MKSITLSEKEKQVIVLLCQELTKREIGEKMFLANRTIDGITEKLRKKLKVKTLVGIAIYAVENGIYSTKIDTSPTEIENQKTIEIPIQQSKKLGVSPTKAERSKVAKNNTNPTATNTSSSVGKSRTLAILPILLALDMFKEIGINNFIGTSKEHEDILNLLPTARKIEEYSTEDMRSFISNSPSKLNLILKSNGFTTNRDRSLDFNLGIVTTTDPTTKWLGKAKPDQVVYENKEYPAARVEKGARIIYQSNSKEMLTIRTAGDILVFIELADKERSGIALFHHVSKLANSIFFDSKPCHAVIPFVDIHHQPDINWVCGLIANNSDLTISQVLQRNRLKINLDGIHAKNTTKTDFEDTSKPRFIINKPFNIWLTYGDPGYNFPLCMAYVTPQHWKEPKM